MQHFTASNPKKEELRVIREGVDAPTCTPHTDVLTRFSSTVNSILSAILLRIPMDIYFDAHPEFSDLKLTLGDYDLLCEVEGPLMVMTKFTMASQAAHVDLGGYVAILKTDLAAEMARDEFNCLDWKAPMTAATTRSSAPRRKVKVEHFRSRGAAHALRRLRLQIKLKLLDEMTDREWLLILLDPRTKLMFHNAKFQASRGWCYRGARSRAGRVWGGTPSSHGSLLLLERVADRAPAALSEAGARSPACIGQATCTNQLGVKTGDKYKAACAELMRLMVQVRLRKLAARPSPRAPPGWQPRNVRELAGVPRVQRERAARRLEPRCSRGRGRRCARGVENGDGQIPAA